MTERMLHDANGAIESRHATTAGTDAGHSVDPQDVQPISSDSRYGAVEETPGPIATPEIIAIGISTGGPSALEKILPRFPGNLPVPILIVQHMPSGFTRPFAERLDTLCSISVREATQSQRPEPGVAYIAPAGTHMRVVKSLADEEPRIVLDYRRGKALHMPSIDELMKSVAELYGNRAIGVIMTGMGSDGAAGIAAIFHQGGLTIGQNEATCTVYGIPRACAEMGVLTRIAPLFYIPTVIVRALRNSR
jgi:two-component system, chemotaxis family, protein-glutamate methylesterase/glutaminase